MRGRCTRDFAGDHRDRKSLDQKLKSCCARFFHVPARHISPASPGRRARARARSSIACGAYYRAQKEAGRHHRRRSHQPIYRRRDSRRPHPHAGPRQRFRDVHSLDGHARISRRIGARDGGSRVAARCGRQAQVLIETVGVGQDEVDIVRLADCTFVVLVPGLATTFRA